MLDVYTSTQFKRDLKQIQRQGRDVNALWSVVDTIAREELLDKKYHDHALTGDFKGHRECHIEPDWLLIYKIDNRGLILTLARTGSHSDLLGKRRRI